ncbi:hypothetical protein C8R45DRAFT_1075810 [Mycena sanguinolenta]|nr:hypothetical protein C8R45DRAFT_1075810 [Mycena sanguinolenta]
MDAVQLFFRTLCSFSTPATILYKPEKGRTRSEMVEKPQGHKSMSKSRQGLHNLNGTSTQVGKVFHALISDNNNEADSLLRAKLFLSVLTGSTLLPVKPTWNVKVVLLCRAFDLCLIAHGWIEDHPTTDVDGRHDFGPDVFISFRSCFQTFTVTNNARLRQLLLSETPVSGQDTEFGRFHHGQILASMSSYTSA